MLALVWWLKTSTALPAADSTVALSQASWVGVE